MRLLHPVAGRSLIRLSPLRSNRDFLRFWSADVISTSGSAISAIAVPLLVLTLGGSVTRAGLIGSCGLVTRLVCRFPAGQVADGVDRRWLMLVTDLIRMVFIGSIPVSAALGRLEFGQLLVVTVVEGVASAMFSAAAAIAMRDVVADDELTTALGSSQAASSFALLLGPMMGGFLFGINRILPFAVDAVSYLLSAVLLLGITIRPPHRAAAPAAPDRRMTAGLRWLRQQPQLLWLLAFVCVINLAGTALDVGIVISLRAQGESGSVVGSVLACLGVGGIVGAMLAPRLSEQLPTGRLFLSTGTIWAIGFCVLASRPAVLVICAVLLVQLLLVPAGVITLEKMVLVQCPREILGRVNTAIGTAMMGLGALGPLLVGAAIANLGVTGAWLSLAALAVLAVVLTARPLLRPVSPIGEQLVHTTAIPLPNRG